MDASESTSGFLGPEADASSKTSDDSEWFERHEQRITTAEDSFERGTALDGLKVRVTSRQFRSGRVTAVLSGVTIDLRDAVLDPAGATLSVQSALSGVDILVPKDWEVSCDVDAVCSGVDAGRAPVRSGPPGPRLRVTGMVVASGLCVR